MDLEAPNETIQEKAQRKRQAMPWGRYPQSCLQQSSLGPQICRQGGDSRLGRWRGCRYINHPNTLKDTTQPGPVLVFPAFRSCGRWLGTLQGWLRQQLVASELLQGEDFAKLSAVMFVSQSSRLPQDLKKLDSSFVIHDIFGCWRCPEWV